MRQYVNIAFCDCNTPSRKMTKTVAFFIRHFTERGTEVSTFAYAHYNEVLLHNRSLIVHFSETGTAAHGWDYIKVSYAKFKERFGDRVIAIDAISDFSAIASKWNVDVFFTQTHGGADVYDFHRVDIWRNVITIKQCVFNTNVIEGTVCCKISSAFGDAAVPVLPYIADVDRAHVDMREELGIPRDAVVFGWIGGQHSFDIADAVYAVNTVANLETNVQQKPVFFVFMNCATEFVTRHNIIHLPRTLDSRTKSIFIETCDAMLHARTIGETFGLACSEFAQHGKPVLTTLCGDIAHICYLGDLAVIYRNTADLIVKLLTFDPRMFTNKVCKYVKFTPENVMNTFSQLIDVGTVRV